MSNEKTILTFQGADRDFEIDHLGLGDSARRGEFVIYEGDTQLADFALSWSALHPNLKKNIELPSDLELIELAKLSLTGDGPKLVLLFDEAFSGGTYATPRVIEARCGEASQRSLNR